MRRQSEKDKRKCYWTYVEKDGGRDEIRDDLAETIRSHYDRLERIADDVDRLGYKVAAKILSVIRRRKLTPRIIGYQRFIAPIGVEPARRITIMGVSVSVTIAGVKELPCKLTIPNVLNSPAGGATRTSREGSASNGDAVWEPEVTVFMDTLLATVRDRARKISKGSIRYRAQHGIEYQEDDDGVDILAYGSERMKPLSGRAREGRANSAGIPILYLASSEQTAISEVRPWIGSELSVAQFTVVRDLRVIDLSPGHGQVSFQHLFFSELLGEEPVSSEKKEEAVWIDVDNAFSRPVTRSEETVEYVPTQILSELFRESGMRDWFTGVNLVRAAITLPYSMCKTQT